jgi:hypothetical protein
MHDRSAYLGIEEAIAQKPYQIMLKPFKWARRIQMQIINWIDTFMTAIVWFIELSQRVFQVLTSDRAKQVYKAIAVFIGILCVAIILGFAKTIQIAFVSAFEAFIEALEIPEASTEILIVQKSESSIPEASTEILTVQKSELLTPETSTEILIVQESKPLIPESPTEILTVQKSEPLIPEASTEILTVQKSEPLMPDPIVPDLRVHSLRKAATAKGIPNAGRMKKAELLLALSRSEFIPCQS